MDARIAAAALLLLGLGLPAPAQANRESESLRARGATALYNLDHDRAIAAFREAVAADPSDPAAHRSLAIGLWIAIAFERGNITVDDYLGGVRRQTAGGWTPPAEAAAKFHESVNQALTLARQQVKANSRDADAQYQVGAALGLQASYIASVEGSTSRAFRSARGAYDAHEKVLDLAPTRKDAALVVGTYRYLVSALSLPLRWAAYVAGFGGGKDRGIQMVEEAAAYGGDNQDDARFSLVLLYNREKRYAQALEHLAALRARYPRNRLLWLETGSTLLRSGRPADAERVLTEGLERFTADERPKMFGEAAIWHYKRGLARSALKQNGPAQRDLERSIDLDGRKWVHGRAHLELGRLALRRGSLDEARRAFQTAAALCEADNDGAAAATARRLLTSARGPGS
jgi:tetratricopeptide (TPR) repeat protein